MGRHELHRDPARPDPCELPDPAHLLLRPALLRGGAAARVQALLARAEKSGLRVGGPETGPSCGAKVGPFPEIRSEVCLKLSAPLDCRAFPPAAPPFRPACFVYHK